MFARYKALWTVPGGGLGVSTLHVDIGAAGAMFTVANLNAVAAAYQDFFADIAGQIPNEVSISFDSEATAHANNGDLVDTLVLSVVPATITGTDAGVWAGGAGAKITWETGIVIAGRRFKGYTYIVPLGAEYDVTGTLSAGCIATLSSEAQNLLTDLNTAGLPMVVFSPTHDQIAQVSTAVVVDKTAILRSRRDS